MVGLQDRLQEAYGRCTRSPTGENNVFVDEEITSLMRIYCTCFATRATQACNPNSLRCVQYRIYCTVRVSPHVAHKHVIPILCVVYSI